MPVTISGSGPITGLTSIASPTTLNGLTIPTLGFGKVLQVVYASTTTLTAVASTTPTDTTLTATITPSSTSSKVLVLATQQFSVSRSSSLIYYAFRLVRGSTDIVTVPDAQGGGIQATGATVVAHVGQTPIIYLDSPASISALTYKVQGFVNTTANSAAVTFQAGNAPSHMVLVEIGP